MRRDWSPPADFGAWTEVHDAATPVAKRIVELLEGELGSAHPAAQGMACLLACVWWISQGDPLIQHGLFDWLAASIHEAVHAADEPLDGDTIH